MEDDDLEKKNIYLHGTYRSLRLIKRFYDLGEYEMAYDEAVEDFDSIAHIIPDEIWLKIGGTIDQAGKKIKRRRFFQKQRREMDYKKCKVLIPVFKNLIKQIPPKGKLYSKPWLCDLYHILLRTRSYFIKEVDLSSINSAPERDEQLIKECFKWLKKYEEHLDHWGTRRVSLDSEYRFMSGITLAYDYFLKQRDKKGVGSFIDIVYQSY